MENIYIVTSSNPSIAQGNANEIRKIFTDMGVNVWDYKFNIPDSIYFVYDNILSSMDKNISNLNYCKYKNIKEVFLSDSTQIPLYL